MIIRDLPKMRFHFNRHYAIACFAALVIITGVALMLAVNHLSHQVHDLKGQISTARDERNQFNSQTRAFQCFDYRQVNGNKTIQVCDGVPTPDRLSTTTTVANK